MTVLRPHLRRVTWFALVAVLGLALMPTLSHALAFARGPAQAWAEVCTPQGVKVVALASAADDAPGTPVSAGQHLEHCRFCKPSSGDALPLPPALPAVTEPLPPGPILPSRGVRPPRTQLASATAQPRAPPGRS